LHQLFMIYRRTKYNLHTYIALTAVLSFLAAFTVRLRCKHARRKVDPVILMLQYHKSGSVYADNLLATISKSLPLTAIKWLPGRSSLMFCERFACFRDARNIIFNAHAPNILCSPFSLFPANLKLVHFMRDPYEMTVSAYLFHRQVPTPEDWVHTTNPCSLLEASLFSSPPGPMVAMEKSLNVSFVNTVETYCDGLFDKKFGSFYKHLRDKPVLEGLRLMYANRMLSEIPTMLWNRAKFRAWGSVLNMQTSTLIEDQLGGTKQILNFMFPAVHTSVKHSMLEETMRLHSDALNNTHVTQRIVSRSARQKMVSDVKSDPVLSPLLLRLVSALADIRGEA